MKKLLLRFFFFAVFCSTNLLASAKTIEKILAVFNNQIITLLQVKRVQEGIAIRREISPHIYNKESFSEKEIVEEIIKTLTIREALAKIGYNLTDDDVEKQIKGNEERLGLQRPQLISFLQNKNTTFQEYHDLIREAMERSIFQSQIIAPTISVPEQLVKNTFYLRNSHDNTLSFKYDLINFIYSPQKYSSSNQNEIKEAIKSYLEKGIFSEKYREIKIIPIGSIEEESLSKNMQQILKNTNEGELSGSVEIDHEIHLFYVKKKDLIESQRYLREKQQIESELTIQEIEKATNLYIQREKNKHYIKSFF